jgi:hypothetical protein
MMTDLTVPLPAASEGQTDFDMICVLAAIVAGRNGCSAAGAVAFAREILEEARSQEPDAFAKHVRSRIAQAQRRAARKRNGDAAT